MFDCLDAVEYPSKRKMSSNSSRNSEEDREDSTPSDAAHRKANDYIKDLFSLLKHETDKARREWGAYDESAKKLERVHFSKTIKLNVGGHFFSTSLETLTKDPGSMLHAMFSGRFETKPSEDGSYFIDRDGTHFRYILNYLRTGELIVPNSYNDKVVRRELLAEAEFYQIEGMINDLSAGAFKDSVILTSDQCGTLMNWLKDTKALKGKNLFPSLLYRATCDGWFASDFHSCCDVKTPTVTVVKSGNYIFGGYTDVSWGRGGSGVDKRAPNSFLFSLINPSGLPPTKMPLIGKDGTAIWCHKDYGPVFGNGRDLCITSSPNTTNCFARLNNSYQCPEAVRMLSHFSQDLKTSPSVKWRCFGLTSIERLTFKCA